MFYTIGFLLIAFGICDVFAEKVNRKRVLIILMFSLWVILSTRGFLGTDWYFYYPSFMDGTYIYEKGYMIYTSIIGGIYKNFIFYQSFTLALDFICLYFLFRKYTKYSVLTFALFFCIQGLFLEVDLLRNMKSILLFMFSLKYLQEKKLIPYLLLNIIGVSFHASSILYLPLYFLLDRDYNKKIILFLFLLGSIIYIGSFNILINFFNEISPYLKGGLGDRIENYISIIPKNIPRGLNMFYLERVVLFLIAFIYEKNRVLKNIAYLSIGIFLYTSELGILSTRIGILFIFITWILYSNSLLYVERKKQMMLLIVTISLFRLWTSLSYPGNEINYNSKNLFLRDFNFKSREKELIESKKYLKDSYGKELLIQY